MFVQRKVMLKKNSNTHLSSLIIGVLELKVSKMNGMSVITADAFTLGEVDGAHADTETLKITQMDVALTRETIKELGLRKPIFGSLTVCLPVSVVKKVGDVVTLGKSLLEFKDMKERKVE